MSEATLVFGDKEEFEQRRRDFDVWVQTVRDPATKATEGVRIIAGPNAEASYQIALLPDGRFALKYSLTYTTGDYSSRHSPWHLIDTREECVEVFVAVVRRHFTPAATGGQAAGRKAVMERLDDTGLFGFAEPEPVPFVISRGVREKLTALMNGEEGM